MLLRCCGITSLLLAPDLVVDELKVMYITVDIKLMVGDFKDLIANHMSCSSNMYIRGKTSD